MNEAHPADRKPFPLGRTLFVGGLVALVLVIATMFYRLYDGTRASFGSITNATPTPIDLPGPGDYILTRAAGITDDRSLQLSVETIGPDGLPTTGSPPVIDNGKGSLTINSQTNQILGRFQTIAAGPVIVTADAAAYPLLVRRDPIAWAVSCLKLAAILGTIAAATTAVGAFIAISRFNQRQRESMQAFEDLVHDQP